MYDIVAVVTGPELTLHGLSVGISVTMSVPPNEVRVARENRLAC